MRYKGFVGSFSTSALLVAAAVSILLTVSAIVAFKGWPGPSGETPTETFLLKGSIGGGDPRPGPEIVLKPAPEPARGTGGSSGGSASGSSGGSTDPGGGGSASSDAVSAPAGFSPSGGSEPVAPAVPASPAPASPPPPATGGGPSVPQPSGGGPIGGTVDRATGALDHGSETVAPVTDRVRNLVTRPTDTVNDLIGGR
jgi:hypothetical protein